MIMARGRTSPRSTPGGNGGAVGSFAAVSGSAQQQPMSQLSVIWSSQQSIVVTSLLGSAPGRSGHETLIGGRGHQVAPALGGHRLGQGRVHGGSSEVFAWPEQPDVV